MKKLRKHVNEDVCIVELHNRRVIVERLPKEKSTENVETIGLCFVKLCKTKQEVDGIYFQHIKRGRNIVQLSMALGVEAAFALQDALSSVIRLSDIPSECLVLNDPIKVKIEQPTIDQLEAEAIEAYIKYKKALEIFNLSKPEYLPTLEAKDPLESIEELIDKNT